MIKNIMKKINKFLFESGLKHTDYSNPIKVFQYVLLNTYILFYIVFVYQFQNFGFDYDYNIIFKYTAIFEIVIAVILFFLYIYLKIVKTLKAFIITKYISTFLLMFLVMMLTWTGGSTHDGGALWALVFIPFSTFLLNKKEAILANIFILLFLGLVLIDPTITHSPSIISPTNARRIIYVYFSIFMGIYYMRKALSVYMHQEQESKIKLEEMMNIDYLTEISNRKNIENLIFLEHKRYKRYLKPYSVIICDVDEFKYINDIHGHNAGDYILKQIASIIKKNIRIYDIVGRWGGDEFMILLPETELKDAIFTANKIRRQIEKTDLSYNKKEVLATVSFGCECIENINNKNDISFLIEEADKKLYQSKKNGRNKIY